MSVHENRIYSLRITCPESYPNQPPLIQFISKVNLPCVHQTTGRIDPGKLPCLAHWKRTYTMEAVLTELRR